MTRPLQHASYQCVLHPTNLQAGICCVGAASLLGGEGSATHPVSQWQMLGGMGLIILSQVLVSRLCPTLGSMQAVMHDRQSLLSRSCVRFLGTSGHCLKFNHFCSQLRASHCDCCLLQAVQAAQITFEDFFLSSLDISALKIVGFEGLWGSLAMFLVMLPVVQVHITLLSAE